MFRWKKAVRHAEKMTVNALVANSGCQQDNREAYWLKCQRQDNTEGIQESLGYLEQQLDLQFSTTFTY